jgi:hypothetical protein
MLSHQRRLHYTLPTQQNNIILITFGLLGGLLTSRDAGMFLDNEI